MSQSAEQGIRRTIEREYRLKLQEYLSGAGEVALADAYDLGRRAVRMRLSLLDLAMIHQEAVTPLVKDNSESAMALAAHFFTETLSPYELSLRAHHDNARLLGLGQSLSQKHDEIDRARHQMRTILNATHALIYLRTIDHVFLFANRRLADVVGVSEERLVGTRGEGALSPDIDQVFRDGDLRALAAKEPLELEETLLLADGEHTYLALKFPLIDELGEPYAVCSVATDISERQRAAERVRVAREAADTANRDLRHAQAQLVHSAKMASLGELVAGIAHEINNPLAFALSHLSTARAGVSRIEQTLKVSLDERCGADWQRVDDRLREMSSGLERIRELVVRLRTFSRLDEGEFKLVSMRESLESVLTILRHRMTDRITVELVLNAPDAIECYPAQLNQALLNLLSNAIEAIAEEGRILVSSSVSAAMYQLEVSDTGGGIPEAVRERIFEPFFTTKPVGQGVGLGLSITDTIIRQHSGTLEVVSTEGKGTTMTMRLPLGRRTQPPETGSG